MWYYAGFEAHKLWTQNLFGPSREGGDGWQATAKISADKTFLTDRGLVYVFARLPNV